MFTRFLLGAVALLLLATSAHAAEEYYEATLHAATASTGNGQIINVENFNTVALTITMSSTGTLTFSGSEDKSTYALKVCTVASSTSGTAVTGATASGTYQCNVAGLQRFRVPISANAGTITVHATVSTAVFTGGGSVGGGAGTEFNEDTAHTTGDLGTQVLGVRRDANTTLAGTDGDYAPFQLDANGNVKVAIIAGAGSGGTAAADNSAITFGTTSMTPIGCVLDEVASNALTENSAGVVRCNSARAMKVDGSAVTQPVSGSVTADTELPVAVSTPNSGAYAPPTAPTIWSFNMCKNGSTYDPCVASPNIAHDAAASAANPLLIGGYANAAAPADVSADLDAVRAWFLRNGALAIQNTFAGVLASTGSGVTGTGVPRVIEASDSPLTAALQLIDDDQTGSSINHRVSVGVTEDEVEIKATAGRLLWLQVMNTNANVRYLRCANLTAASTTPGTSTVFYGTAVPGATTGAGLTISFGPSGIAFSTALTCWLVTGAAETDVAEVAANELTWNIGYK